MHGGARGCQRVAAMAEEALLCRQACLVEAKKGRQAGQEGRVAGKMGRWAGSKNEWSFFFGPGGGGGWGVGVRCN